MCIASSCQNVVVTASKVVLWDFDGTLAQRPGRWSQCLAETIAQVDRSATVHPDDLKPGLRNGFPWHRHEEGHPELNNPDDWWNALLPLLIGAYCRAGIDRQRAITAARMVRTTYVDPAAWTVYSDTLPALSSLHKAGWRHLVVSNHVPELPRLVRSLGLADLVDDVLTSATVGWEKPHPSMFRQALASAGHPDTVIMVGDNPEADVAGALRAGIPALLVRNATPGDADLHAVADRILTQF